MILYLIQIVDWIFNFYFIIFGIRILLSWVNPDPYNPIVQFIHKATDPLMSFIRRILPFSMSVGVIDFSPIIAILLLELVKTVMIRMLWTLV